MDNEVARETNSDVNDASLSSLDMSLALDFYANHQYELRTRLRESCSDPSTVSDLPQITNAGETHLSAPQIAGIWQSFPVGARRRSIAKKILCAPTLWFSKDSKPGAPSTTDSPELALSPTAFVPSYIDYSSWRQTGVPSATVNLYAIPNIKKLGRAGESTASIVLTQALYHELAHSVFASLVYGGVKNKIRFVDDGKIDGAKFIARFAELTAGLPPISQYSSFYRNGEGDYPEFSAENPMPFKLAIDEELAESVAAYLLGFTFCSDEERCLNPFRDRPEVLQFVRQILTAEKA